MSAWFAVGIVVALVGVATLFTAYIFVHLRLIAAERDLRGARLSCSAEAKKANRLAARIAKLDRALERHRAQARHDQSYIDALESRLEYASIEAARSEIVELGESKP